MITKFEPVINSLKQLIFEWEPKLLNFSQEIITERRNSQNRNIKQIVGHMIDSASNNIHRIVHLQYCENPLIFPNYATHGNNNRWIAIQNYENEDWSNMVHLWKYLHLHIAHVMSNVDPSKLKNEWLHNNKDGISLKKMVIDFLRHFQLHIDEITDLIKKN